MSLPLLLLILFAVCFELFILNSVISFLNKKITSKVLIKSIVSAGIIVLLIVLGIKMGTVAKSLFSEKSAWFGASIIFVLSLKYLYQAIRLKAIRNTINPLDNKGFVLLMVSPSINALFIGVALGLIYFCIQWYIYIILFCLLLSLMGLFIGKLLKKLIGFKYELLISIALLISAIILVINN